MHHHLLRPGARSWTTRLVAVAPLTIALAVIVASCGGGGSSNPAAPATTTTVAGGRFNRAALQPFLTCLTQHGVAVPTTVAGQQPPASDQQPPGTDTGPTGTGPRRNGGGGGGFGALGRYANSTDPATMAAFKACEGQLPAGALQQFQQGQTARQAFVSCMKDHGVTVSNGGGGFGGPGGPGAPGATTSTTTPAYAAAFKVCSPLLPQRGPGGPGRSTTTTA